MFKYCQAQTFNFNWINLAILQFTWFARCPISAYPRVHVSPGVHDAVKYHDVGLQWILVILRFCLSHGEPETNKHNFWNASNELNIHGKKYFHLLPKVVFHNQAFDFQFVDDWVPAAAARAFNSIFWISGAGESDNILIFRIVTQLPLHYRYVFKRRNF